MIFNTGKSKLVIDLDSCEGIFIKQNGEECTLKDYIYKLVLLALIRREEEHSKEYEQQKYIEEILTNTIFKQDK